MNETTKAPAAERFQLLDTDNLSGIPEGWLSLVREASNGKSYEDIAAGHSLNLGTVKSRIHRTRSRILVQRALSKASAEGAVA